MANYLFISSAYRNRLLYPNASDFVIPFGQISSPTVINFSVLNTFNPISVFPVYSFCWTNFDLKTNIIRAKIVGGSRNVVQIDKEPINSIFLGLNNDKNRALLSSFLSQSVFNIQSYFKNYLATTRTPEGVNSTVILDYSPIYSTLTLADPIPFKIGDFIEITNQSTPNSLVLNGNFNTSIFSDNDLFIYNISKNEVSRCFLNEINSELIIEKTIRQDITDKYLLYDNLYPFVIGSVNKFKNNSYYLESGLSSFTITNKGRGYSYHQEVFLSVDVGGVFDTNCSRLIVKKIDSMGGIEELQLMELGCQCFTRNKYYYILVRDGSIKTTNDIAILFVNDVSTIFLCKLKTPNALRPRDYVGKYFTCFLLSPLYRNTIDSLFTVPNNVFPVLTDSVETNLYDSQIKNGVFGIEKIQLVSESEVLIFVQKVPADLLLRFVLLDNQPLEVKSSAVFQDALHFCVQDFLREGIVPLNFSGTYLTQSVISCYEMTVLNLILPNVQINALNSLLTSGYPYVLLEISNVTMPSSGNKNVIYSNNPFSISSTFVCSISDVNDPTRTKFIKINSDGAIQIIKFTPADNLRFRILLPSGEPFITLQRDYLPPSIPNPTIQISMMLELKKL